LGFVSQQGRAKTRQRKQFFFEKKEPKNFSRALRAKRLPVALEAWHRLSPRLQRIKVFCFFFAKKKRFLPLLA
jgi:hypothetical protein